MANSLTQVGGPAIAPPGANKGQSMVPFRQATTGRTTQLQSSAGTNVGTATNSFDVVIEGSGFAYDIDLDYTVTCTGNAAAVTYFEDAPWSTYPSIVFRDVNGELINLPGISLRFANLYGSYTARAAQGVWNNYTTPPVPASATSPDPSVAYLSATVGPGDGGSYRMHLEVPIGLNRRNLWGILANQDRAQKYSLRTDIASAAAAAAGPIYTTAPTTQGTYTLVRTYENYAVPGPSDANGNKQQQLPPQHGIVNFWTQSVNPSAPTASSTTNHYLARLGNTIRTLILVYRSGATATARANAEGLLPSRIQFNLGDTPIFVESPGYRRYQMLKRYGFNAPQGVFAYDFITDFDLGAGAELGDDYLWTSGLVNSQFAISYPAGVTTASLTVITGDSLIPPNVNIYG
jgi:hypothetical protein